MPRGASTSASSSASATTRWRGPAGSRSSVASASASDTVSTTVSSPGLQSQPTPPGLLERDQSRGRQMEMDAARERDRDAEWVTNMEKENMSKTRIDLESNYANSDRGRKLNQYRGDTDGLSHQHGDFAGHHPYSPHYHSYNNLGRLQHQHASERIHVEDDVTLPPFQSQSLYTSSAEPLPPPPPLPPALPMRHTSGSFPTQRNSNMNSPSSYHSHHLHNDHHSHSHSSPNRQHRTHTNVVSSHQSHVLATAPYPTQLQPRTITYENQAQITPPPTAPVQVEPLYKSKTRELGLSATYVVTADEKAIYVYVSESLADILGYQPHDLLGKSIYLIFHPDEIPRLREVHYQALTNEKVACVTYMRLLHQEGYYVECAVSYSTVYDRSVAMVTRAVDGPRQIQQAATAREVIEVSPGSQGRFHLKRWSIPSPNSSSIASPISRPVITPPSQTDVPWDLPRPSPRTFFLLDRFTDSARVLYVSNDVIVSAASLKNEPFFSIVKPSERQRVRQWIDAAKNWTPVMYDESRTGGHGFTTFHVLKIPDLPPKGSNEPQGTDASERIMPGQEFIPVEAIFTASSDDVACIINRITSSPPQYLT